MFLSFFSDFSLKQNSCSLLEQVGDINIRESTVFLINKRHVSGTVPLKLHQDEQRLSLYASKLAAKLIEEQEAADQREETKAKERKRKRFLNLQMAVEAAATLPEEEKKRKKKRTRQ